MAESMCAECEYPIGIRADGTLLGCQRVADCVPSTHGGGVFHPALAFVLLAIALGWGLWLATRPR